MSSGGMLHASVGKADLLKCGDASSYQRACLRRQVQGGVLEHDAFAEKHL